MGSNESTSLTYSFPDLEAQPRLAELMLYIAEKCKDDPGFGATKLNKILYFSDFLSYQLHGKPITGTEYMRLGKGPVPRRLLPVRRDLIESGDAELRTQDFHGYDQHRLLPKREPNIELFKAREIAIVDDLIALVWGKTADEVSDLSHGIAWRLADDGESIPYEAVFLSDEDLTPEEYQRVQELIEEHGWDG